MTLRNTEPDALNDAVPQEALWQHAPVALCLLDNEFRIRQCNDSFLELLQLKYDDCSGNPISNHITGLTPQILTEIKKTAGGRSANEAVVSLHSIRIMQRDYDVKVRITEDKTKELSFLCLSLHPFEAEAVRGIKAEVTAAQAFSGLKSEVILIWGADFKETYHANKAFEFVFKMDAGQIFREPFSWLDRVHVEDRKFLEPLLRGRRKAALFSEFGHQFRIVWPDGSLRWGWACFGLSNGMIVSTIRDITEEKRNLMLGKRVLDSMPTLNYIFNIVEKKTSYRGGRGYELLGYKQQYVAEAPDDFFVGLMDPEALAQWTNVIERWKGVKDDEVLKVEFRLRDAQGKWRWFLSTNTVYSRMANGKVKEVIGTAQEITDRKNTEEERRKSDERFRRYFDLGLIGFAVTSLRKGWLEVNDYICKMLDYSCDELKRKTWVELTYPDDLQADLDCFKQLLAGEIEAYTLDKRFIRKDGTPVYTSIAVSCVRNNAGEPDHIVVLIQDISGRKRAEKELSRYRDHLEELVKARTAELYETNEKLRQEISERRQIEATLQKKNIALNEILGQIEIEKKAVRDQIIANVERLLLPTIKKLSVEDRELRQDYIALLVRNLKEMTSSFGANITSKYYKLTPREIEICNMIKSRLSNKEISRLLNISLRTVETHRNDIRKKLSLSHKTINLATYLQSM